MYSPINVLYLHLLNINPYNYNGVEMSFNFVVPQTLNDDDHTNQ